MTILKTSLIENCYAYSRGPSPVKLHAASENKHHPQIAVLEGDNDKSSKIGFCTPLVDRRHCLASFQRVVELELLDWQRFIFTHSGRISRRGHFSLFSRKNIFRSSVANKLTRLFLTERCFADPIKTIILYLSSFEKESRVRMNKSGAVDTAEDPKYSGSISRCRVQSCRRYAWFPKERNAFSAILQFL